MRLLCLFAAALLSTACGMRCCPKTSEAPLPCPTVVMVSQVYVELRVLDVPTDLLKQQPTLAGAVAGGHVVLPLADAHGVLAVLTADKRTTTIAMPAMLMFGEEEGVLEVGEFTPEGAWSGLRAEVIPTVPWAGPDVTLDVDVQHRAGPPSKETPLARVTAKGVQGGFGTVALLVEPERPGATMRLVVSVDARVLEQPAAP